MKRIAILIISILFLAPIRSIAADDIEAVFSKIRQTDGVTTDSVHYTGSDRSKANGFRMQRGSGNGWTKGERITVHSVKPKTLKHIMSTFKGYIDKGHGYSNNNWACLFFEPTKTFFGYEYSPENNTLWLLKASTDGEICIPGNWTEKTYLDATMHAPFAGATEDQLKLLGLSRLWEGVNRWFVFRDRMTVDWDSLYVAAMPEMLAAKTRQEWTDVLRRMAANAHDGHTMVYGHNDLRHAPFTTIMIDSCVYIKDIYDDKLGIAIGDRIESIDNQPVIEYADKNVVPYIASSTPQWTIHKAYDGFGLLNRLPDDTVRIKLGNGKTVEYVSGHYGKNTQTFGGRIFKFSKPTEDIAILKINSFMGSDFKRQFSELYDSIYESKALIIDVRNNGGGNSGNGDFILRLICSDSIPTARWESPTTVPALKSWGKTAEPYRGGGEKMSPYQGVPLYSGPVAILTDRGTFSAAEDFVSLFRGVGRGIVIGTPTGGSTGNGVVIELIPNHTWANICSKHDTAPDGTEFVGIGIIPDITVNETWESIFNSETDIATSKAIEYLNGIINTMTEE